METSLTFFHAFNSGLLEERFKIGFLTIYHSISQQKKEKAFQILFDEKINIYSQNVVNSLDFESFVQKIVHNNWLNYLDHLKLITIDKIEPYVLTLVKSIYNSYNEQLVNLTINTTQNTGIWYFISSNMGKLVSLTI